MHSPLNVKLVSSVSKECSTFMLNGQVDEGTFFVKISGTTCPVMQHHNPEEMNCLNCIFLLVTIQHPSY